MNSLKHLRYIEKLSQALLVGKQMPSSMHYTPFYMEVQGFVEPKERARTSRTGHHYTPTDTRKFEAMVKEHAIETMRKLQIPRFNCPVAIHLQIFDKIHSDMPEWLVTLAKAGLYFAHTGGDLDNKEKAVLDAINKVVYTDDRLVVQSYKFRRFSDEAGFKLTVTPCGITKADTLNIEKMLTYGRKHAKEEATNSVT